jgi:hypothetical protein
MVASFVPIHGIIYGVFLWVAQGMEGYLHLLVALLACCLLCLEFVEHRPFFFLLVIRLWGRCLERLRPMVARIRRQLSLWCLRLRPTGVDYDRGGRFFGRLYLRRNMVCSPGSECISHALCCS